MPAAAETIIGRLSEINADGKDGPDLVGILYEIVDEAEQLPEPSALLSNVFEFFEKWPAADLGAPGPLVHFVEQFFPGGYEKLLLESLGRQPVSHTVWMANRLLNSTKITESLRARLIGALEQAVEHPRSETAVREEAEDFLQHQRSARPCE